MSLIFFNTAGSEDLRTFYLVYQRGDSKRGRRHRSRFQPCVGGAVEEHSFRRALSTRDCPALAAEAVQPLESILCRTSTFFSASRKLASIEFLANSRNWSFVNPNTSCAI